MTHELFLRLAAPFADDDVQFKPQAVKGNRALAIAYIDARAVMDRLDEVLGPANWQDEYHLLPEGAMLCKLSVRVDGEWIAKTDVGSPSDQPDGGDRTKAAVSDALKRAAVKLGIGRYLYNLPHQWADYDPVRRQFVSPPRLPEWATAKGKAAGPRPKADDRPESARSLPAAGAELHRPLREADAGLVGKGLCPVGALLTHVTQAGVKAGFGADISPWSGPAIELAVTETKAFKARLVEQPGHVANGRSTVVGRR
jgi:Rad52/22 family double-strand break repair protein